MNNVDSKEDVTPIALTDDLTAMTDYVSSAEGRAAISRGIADIREGRIIEGRGVLSTELTRRGEIRRA